MERHQSTILSVCVEGCCPYAEGRQAKLALSARFIQFNLIVPEHTLYSFRYFLPFFPGNEIMALQFCCEIGADVIFQE